MSDMSLKPLCGFEKFRLLETHTGSQQKKDCGRLQYIDLKAESYTWTAPSQPLSHFLQTIILK